MLFGDPKDPVPLVPPDRSTFTIEEIESAVVGVPWFEYLTAWPRVGWSESQASTLFGAKVAVAVMRNLSRHKGEGK